MATEHFEPIADFFVDKPLYAEVSVEIVSARKFYVMSTLPPFVERDCEQCNQQQRWDRIEPGDIVAPNVPSTIESNAFHSVIYKCRNCRKATLRVWFHFLTGNSADGKSTLLLFKKFGHYPQLETNPPANLRKALDRKHLTLYRRAKTLRHNGYGIGALAYLRRLVEDLADEMLGLLIETLQETDADGDAIRRVRQAKDGTVFKDKAKVAANALPAPLRPGGINPFTALYEMPSEGLHALSDEECCAIVDRVALALEFIYVNLKVHVDERKAYVEALKELSKAGKPTP